MLYKKFVKETGGINFNTQRVYNVAWKKRDIHQVCPQDQVLASSLRTGRLTLLLAF